MLHKFNNGWIELTIATKNELEDKMVECFRRGIVWLRWNSGLEQAEIIPKIFKVKYLPVSMIIRYEDVKAYFKVFLNYWSSSRLIIKWDEAKKDFFIIPKVPLL